MLPHTRNSTMNKIVLVDMWISNLLIVSVSLLPSQLIFYQKILQTFLRSDLPTMASDQKGGQIDRGAARTGDDPVILDIAFVDQCLCLGEAPDEFVSDGEVHCTAPTIQQPSLAKNERC